jgi:multiple antibiotic resistance protein
MEALSFVKVLLTAFVTLFPVVNPIGDAPIFLALTQQYPKSAQRILARKTAAYGFALLAVSFLFGSIVLDFFGISLFVVEIAGGLPLLAGVCSIKKMMVRPGLRHRERWRMLFQHAFFPLTLPITVGPGCISIALTLGAYLRHQAGPEWERGFPHHFIAALLGMFLLCALVMICYENADRLVRMLGKSRTTILTRLSAFILLAIGVQIMWNGLKTGIPQLFSFIN